MHLSTPLQTYQSAGNITTYDLDHALAADGTESKRSAALGATGSGKEEVPGGVRLDSPVPEGYPAGGGSDPCAPDLLSTHSQGHRPRQLFGALQGRYRRPGGHPWGGRQSMGDHHQEG